jgi:hypothetical protein
MSKPKQFTSGIIDTITKIIPNGQTKTASIDTFGVTLVEIELPAAFDGTALTFETSSDNITFQPYYNINNVPVSITCAQGRNYGIAAQDFFAARYLKIVSNASETGDRTLKLVTKSI